MEGTFEEWQKWPQIIRALILQWAIEPEGKDEGSESAAALSPLLATAAVVAERILSMVAPLEWAWASFPLAPDGETVSISFVADAMEALAQLEAAGVGGHYVGRAAHIAHILKSTQHPEGWWYENIDARSGEPRGAQRCAASPLLLFCRLDQLLEGTEFTQAAIRSRDWLLKGSVE